MNTLLLKKRINLIAYAIAVLFLMIHIAMFILFLVNHVAPMVYVNIFSMLFYLGSIVLIAKSRLVAFGVASYIEINIHMALAIIFTGWDAGFQITLIGIVILLFLSEYFARSLKMKILPTIYLAPIAAIAYLSTYIVTIFYDSPYKLPQGVNVALQIGWAVIVFVIMSAALLFFVSVATRSEKELANEVTHDKLTGLPNRYYMASFFQNIQKDTSSRKHWIAIADIDDFKMINDTRGHNCGDYVLQTIASLMTAISPSIEVCRWGGEEFLLVGDDRTSPSDALEELRKSIESYPFNYEGEPMSLTMTIGFAWKKEEQSIDEWINDADKCLYHGKESGKNIVCQ